LSKQKRMARFKVAMAAFTLMIIILYLVVSSLKLDLSLVKTRLQDIQEMDGVAIITKPSPRISTSNTTTTQQEKVAIEMIDVEGKEINIDESSTMAQDIVRIWHDASMSSVKLELKQNANCSNPYLRGRLSGPSLSILEWEKPTQTNNGTTLVTGRYHSMINGTHFLEIIVLFCNDFEFNTDFTKICLEDTRRHRLTALNSTIDIPSSAKPAPGQPGFWVSKLGRTFNPQVHQPLYTRVQPQGCRAEPDSSTDRCQIPMRAPHFESYGFVFFIENVYEWSRALPNKDEMISCFVGASHSRKLAGAVIMFLKHPARQLHRNFVSDVTPDYLESAIGTGPTGCKKVVIGVGQWDASFQGRRPTLLYQYEERLGSLLTNLAQNLTLPAGVEMSVRSMHYSALGEKVSACPPQDWRNPKVVDEYNAILKRLTAQFNVPYIDTNSIVSPMWDHSGDWNHLDLGVQRPEAVYMFKLLWG
jgi:hypothetical protein